jgi:hypothetical protein
MQKDKLKNVSPALCEGLNSSAKMNYFNNEKQNNFKSDFGFNDPHRTAKECSEPVFADKHLHRLAIIKHEHLGSKGDRDENGIAGWVAKTICTGCGKEYKRGFYVDKRTA